MFDPSRTKPDLIVQSSEPFNAEPRLDRLRTAFTTGLADFYVRSHGNVPLLDEANFRLHVTGRVRTPLHLSMANLRQDFAKRGITAVMQCAGNRRADLQPVGKTTGNPWAPGAIGNAIWTGVALADVLRAAGAENGTAMHVAFDAADETQTPEDGRFTYGASIPMAKAMSPEVLLAYGMNDANLAPEHGFPLRVVVPGYAGARSPKWLTAITVQDAPSANPMQQHDYKILPPDMTAATLDWSKGFTINEMPLNSAICEPAPHARLPEGATMLRGYAIATGRSIVRVDVSIDGGKRWAQAVLEDNGDTSWSWTFWHAAVVLTAGAHELVVRAWDSAGQTQPARAEDVWNFKGYLSTAWHRVPVSVG